MKWLLNIIYIALLTLLSPVIAWRMIRHGRYRAGIAEKLFGRLPVSLDDRPVVWFHAVSVGEVVQLQKIVDDFCGKTQNRYRIVVTTSTDTGFELARTRLSDHTVTWFPLDFSWAVSNAISRVRPAAVVLFELELWPNFINACRSSDTKITVINARMSDRSFAGYSKVKGFLRPLLSSFECVAVQTDEYAERFRRLGCREDAVHVTGSVKFDGVLTDRGNTRTRELRELFGIADGEFVFIAGSTQDPEESLALKAWAQVRQQHPSLRLILVPRHRERFDEVADLVVSSDFPLTRRSSLQGNEPAKSESVILLDTIGELSACWGLADIAFVGGSFGSRGGQNMLEPAAFGAAVLFGPNTSNFRDIVARLKSENAALQLNSEDELASTLQSLMDDENRRRQLGEAAQSVVESQQGAIDRTVDLLLKMLNADDRR